MPAPIKIEIPVHEEAGWTVRSPEGAATAVKARLEEQRQSPKSPETLQKMMERAAFLHQLHIEATQQRAAREVQRAKDVAAARLRAEATMRQNLLARFEASDAHKEHKKRALETQTKERLARHGTKHDAVRAAREAAKAEREHRAAVIRSREEAAAHKHEKALEQTVQRLAFQAKQALVKATAIKEKQQADAADAAEKLCARLEAASSRRMDATQPGTKEAKSKAGASKVARVLFESQAEAAKKAAAAELAMEYAQRKRDELRDLKVTTAIKLAPAKQAKEAAQAAKSAEAAAAARAELFAKLNAADARRALALRRRAREGTEAQRKATKALLGAVIEVDVASFAARPSEPKPPRPELLARLMTKSEGGAERALLHKAREGGAAARRALSLAAIKSKAAKRAECAGAAARRRALRLETRRAAAEARTSRGAALAEASSAAKLAARREGAAARAAAAAARREQADEARCARYAASAARVLVAGALREAVLTRRAGTTAARATAVEVRRAKADLAVAMRGTAALGRCVSAAKRRGAFLSARAAKARLAALPRSQPAKLTIEQAGHGPPWVHVVIGPRSSPQGRGRATPASPAATPKEEQTLASWQLEGWRLPADDEPGHDGDKEADKVLGDWQLVSPPGSYCPSEA